MNDRTIVSLARLACGTALLIAHAVTGINGLVVNTAMLLLALPVERLVPDGARESSKN